jgi:hypothetical protein
MLVNNVNSLVARCRVTDVATMLLEEKGVLCSGDGTTAVAEGTGH